MLRKQRLLPLARQLFRLAADPFGAEIRCLDDVYMPDSLRFVAESLYMTAKHGGMLGVVGESGSGKSTLRRATIDRLRREGLPVLVVEPYVIAMDENPARGKPLLAAHITEAILRALNPCVRVPSSPEARFHALHKALQESARAGNRHVLIIEEAHDLHVRTLKHLKRFYELEDAGQGSAFDRLLGIILFGQPELAAKLGEGVADVREVVQRMELLTLGPLDDPEAYVRHRLGRAGVEFERIFAADAGELLLAAGRGGCGGHSPPVGFKDAVGATRELAASATRGTRREPGIWPLALNNRLVAACNLAAELGFGRVTADILRRVL